MAHDLHIFLKSKPTLSEMETVLKLFGFRAVRSVKSRSMVEPDHHEWRWAQHPLSGAGFDLLYFESLFRDSLHAGKYQALVVMEGPLDASEHDLAMIDVTAALLLRRYGGVLHNPNRTDRKHPNVFLCGKNNTKA